MDYFRRFTFLFAAPVFDTDDLEGLRFNQIVAGPQPYPMSGIRSISLSSVIG
jgi:hypothetical protein